ncbi:MAG: PadR family transcriptional regulator, partial [Microbacterium sp.]
VARWLAAPVARAQGTRDELAIKLAVAATLPGVDVATVIRDQRAASVLRLEELSLDERADADPHDAAELARSLVASAMRFAVEAEVRWLDHAERRLREQPPHVRGLGLSTERPRRGRPAKAHPIHSIRSPQES